MKYRAEIDGLRAVAVVPVVLFHAGIKSFSGGYVGVDIFFVISGFLITSLITEEVRQGTFSIAGFYERRIRRILPALFVVMLACTAAVLMLYTPMDLKDFSKSLSATALFGSNIVFWNQAGYFDNTGTKPLLHTWSLAVEEQFYIVFPLFLAALHRWGHDRWIRAVAVVGLLSFALCLWSTVRIPVAAFYLSPMRAWELMLGALIALRAFPAPANQNYREVLIALGLALIGWSIFAFSERTEFPGWHALLPCAGAALIIQAVEGGSSRIGTLLRNRGMVGVGLISYSLYLWHWPLIVFGKYALQHQHLAAQEIAAVVALSFLLAYLSWRFVEAPFRRRNGVAARPMLFRGAAACIAAFVAIGVSSVAAAGWPGRLPPDLASQAWVRTGEKILRNPDRHRCLKAKPQKACAIAAAPGVAPNFVLWGDSHAESMRLGLEEAARRHGAAGYFLGAAGCLPATNLDRHDSDSRKCDARSKANLDAILQDRNAVSVVMAGRWAMYMQGKRFGQEPGSDWQMEPGTTAHNAVLVSQHVTATVEQLLAAGRRVYLVAGVPEVGYDVPRVLVLNQWLGLGVPLTPSHDGFLERNREVDQLMATLGTRRNVTVLEPASRLCGSQKCDVERQQMPLYADNNHLSRFGATEISSIFEPVFAQGSASVGQTAADGSESSP